MTQWSIVYEYCDTPTCAEATVGRHANCTGQKTVVIQSFPDAPLLNLLTAVHPWNHAADVAPRSTHAYTSLTFRMPMPLSQFLGFALLALGIGGIVGPFIPELRMESTYLTSKVQQALYTAFTPAKAQLPKSAPVVFDPLVTPDGAPIAPINEEFSLIVPEIGINAPIVAEVDPAKPTKYAEVLLQGIAHASTSFLPDQDGTVYLFSHSTNYDWFVRDLNAVFYLLKNVEKDDLVVLIYKGKRYTYKITAKKVVSPKDTSFLVPTAGRRNLILQTCWPPGSTTERLLIFADLIQEQGKAI